MLIDTITMALLILDVIEMKLKMLLLRPSEKLLRSKEKNILN